MHCPQTANAECLRRDLQQSPTQGAAERDLVPVRATCPRNAGRLGKDYNAERPSSRLGWQTPTEFAQTFASQRALTQRNPRSTTPVRVAQTAQMGKPQTLSLAHTG